MAREAWRALDPQTLEGVEPGADKHFHEIRLVIEAALPSMTLQQEFELNAFSLGDSGIDRRPCARSAGLAEPYGSLSMSRSTRRHCSARSVYPPFGSAASHSS